MKKILPFLLLFAGCNDFPDINQREFYKFPQLRNLQKIYSTEMEYSRFEITHLGHKNELIDVNDIFSEKSAAPYDIMPSFSEIEPFLKQTMANGNISMAIDTGSLVEDRWFGNMPKSLSLEAQEEWYAKAHENEKPAEAYPVYIFNTSDHEIIIRAHDLTSLDIIQEAKDDQGVWRPIEFNLRGFCGLGNLTYLLKPDYYLVAKVYKYSGDFSTELRLKLKMGQSIVYSNTFNGSINRAQFIVPDYVDEGALLQDSDGF